MAETRGVRSGLQGGRGPAGPGDRQADRAGGPGAGCQLGVFHTLGNWVGADRREAGGGELSADERAELARLRKECTELRMRCDVLKRSLVLWLSG